MSRSRSFGSPGFHQVGGHVNRLPDAMVTAAAASVRHRRVDIGVGRVGASLQQGERAHDHAGLAVAALRRIEFLPCNLDRMAAIGRDSFDRGDFLADRGLRAHAAGSDRLTIDMQRARAALPDAATEFSAGEAEMIANHPQQWRLRVRIDGMSRSIHVQIERHTLPPLDSGIVVDAFTASNAACGRTCLASAYSPPHRG